MNIYYTAHEGRRNVYGHTTTRGTVYKIDIDYQSHIGEAVHCLVNLGDYVHQSGGADISASILAVCEKNGIDTNGGYCKHWRDNITLIQL
jgi:hypothetical protein